MELIALARDYVVPFLVLVTVLVYVHELGHYLVARLNGVRIEVFSIGFGPELAGWTDKHGTRWKFSALPLGGYVKMFGDADPASMPGESLSGMTMEERAVAFHHKRVGQRLAIVAAGPAANYVFAVIVLAGIFVASGQPFSPPEVSAVVQGGAAEAAGIKAGDRFLNIDGDTIERFEDIQERVRLNPGQAMTVVVRRDGAEVGLALTPRIVEQTNVFGHRTRMGQIGIRGGPVEVVQHPPMTALWRAVKETWGITVGTLRALGQMAVGTRTTEELGGPLRIAQMSGEMAQGGVVSSVWFAALLSINLGLINLFPVPMLDGGHILYYLIEAIRGRPLSQKVQAFGFRIGLALVATLMIFATWNDLVVLPVMDFVRRLIS